METSSSQTTAAHSTPTTPATADQTAPAATAPALKSASVTHTYKDASGYTCSVKMTVWDREPADATSPIAHPLDSAITLNPSSDYDPQTDVVIPVSVTLTNTTKGFDIDQPGITWDVVGLTCGSKELTEARSLEYWGWFADGWATFTWKITTGPLGVGAWLQTLPSVEWSDPLPPQGEDVQNGFFVYRDQLTPVEPHGTAWILDSLVTDPMLTEVFNNDSSFRRHGSYLALSGKVIKMAE